MGLAYNTYLTSNKIYGCKTCKAHLANHEDIISRVRILLPQVSLVFAHRHGIVLLNSIHLYKHLHVCWVFLFLRADWGN